MATVPSLSSILTVLLSPLLTFQVPLVRKGQLGLLVLKVLPVFQDLKVHRESLEYRARPVLMVMESSIRLTMATALSLLSIPMVPLLLLLTSQDPLVFLGLKVRRESQEYRARPVLMVME